MQHAVSRGADVQAAFEVDVELDRFDEDDRPVAQFDQVSGHRDTTRGRCDVQGRAEF